MGGTTISGGYTSGITLSGAVNNPAYVSTTGSIDAPTNAALYGPSGITWTLINGGSLTAPNGAGIELAVGGTATNLTTGVINALYGIAFEKHNATGTAYNAGHITATSVGVVSYYALVLTNAASGRISGYDGVYTGGAFAGGGAGTVTNSGGISGTGNGVYLRAGGTVTNQFGGLITASGVAYSEMGVKGARQVINDGTIAATRDAAVPGVQQYHSAVGVDSQGGGISVTNQAQGVIIGQSTANYVRAYGIYSAATATVVNMGTIEATAAGPATAIKFQSGGDVFNRTGGLIETDGFNNRAVYIKAFGDAVQSVVNAGTISGGAFAAAVELNARGQVVNLAGGVLSGNYGVVTTYSATAVESITNAGTIQSSGHGISINNQPGAVINETGGTINANFGVSVGGDGGSLINQAGAIITGVYAGVAIYSAAGTVTNAGTIIGTGVSSPYGRYGAVLLPAGFANRVVVDPGAVFQGKVDGANAIGASAVSTVELAAGTGTITGFGTQFINFGSIAFDAGANWFVQGDTAGLGGTISGFAQGDTIEIAGITVTGTNYAGGVLTLTDTTGTATLDLPGVFATPAFLVTNVANGADVTLGPVCFLPGTLITTPTGETEVERLSPGDTVLTSGGRARRIEWVGTGRVLATRGRRNAATPVIVRKGALGDNVPHTDLRVTKAHSFLIDGVLVPVAFIVNHRTILWDDHAQEVTIYHIELATHDVILANGAPAETYRDDGNRWLFQNANTGWDLPPQAPCAPVLTGGAVLDAIWRRLLDRAGPRPPLPLTDDPDLHLMVDGVRLDAMEQTGQVHVFRLRAVPSVLRLVSRTATPAEWGLSRDPRALGIAIKRLVVRKGTRFSVIAAHDDRLEAGFHAFEADNGLRWTDGDAVIAGDLYAGFSGPFEVVVHAGATTRYLAEGAVRHVA
jgi:hypothetical protein